MSANVVISNLLRQAQLTATYKNKVAESVVLQAIFITPGEQIKAPKVIQFTEQADFIQSRSEFFGLVVELQPGVYQDKILKYRDDLTVQVISSTETEVMVREFVAIPLEDNDPRAMSLAASNANFASQDSIGLTRCKFQLMDPGYAKLKNIPVSDNFTMSNVEDVLRLVMDSETRKVEFTTGKKYKGMHIHTPVDNVNKYRQILIPAGTRLVSVPLFLQNHEEYGVYSKGLGSFFKQGYWWVFPLFNTNLVETHHKPIDLIRMPRDKIPTLDETMYISPAAFTIISTGDATHNDGGDIRKQNKGVGTRIVMGDSISGDSSYHFSKGKAITTRAESLQEYKLSSRRDGEEFVPLDLTPTGNVCKAMSANALNEGEFISVNWQNGDVGYLEPGHPVRYQYMSDNDQFTTRNGVLIGYRSDYVPVTGGLVPQMKRTCVLQLFLKRQERYKAET